MSWIYPERWSGWLEHARVGGGLFDDPNSFARIVQSCWEQYCLQNDLAAHTPLTPLPQLRIVFSPSALAQEEWAPCFQALEMWFNPTLNGFALPFTLHPPSEEEGTLLREPRNFFFQLESPRRQSLRCLFLLGEQMIGAIPLGDVQLNGDSRDFTITRRFGITKSSDISRCIESNALSQELPETMREDLRYLGWRLRFRSWGGEETIQFEEVAATGRLHGGELHVHDGMRCALGQAITIYEGQTSGTNRQMLRMLIVPHDVQPAAPEVVHLQAFAHTCEGAPPQLEILAWLHNGPLDDQILTLTMLEQGAQFQLREVGLSEDARLYQYQLLTTLPPKMKENEPFSCRLKGQNRYGLSLLSRPQEVMLQGALRAHFQGPSIVQRRQLEQDWEIRFRLEGELDPHAIDLASLTLWLRADEMPAISIPLAHVQKETLVFRFLPRVIQMQLPLERILQAHTLYLWLEQHQEEAEETTPWRLCVAGNRADTPRVSLRVVSFDASEHLIESGTETTLPLHGELQLEGHRLQIIPSLYQANLPSTSEREIWDLVLYEEEDGPRRIRLTHQGAGWMRVQRRRKQADPTGQEVRALWFSCAPEDQRVPHPKERNPAGGPCFAFGLGWGQTQEMAQIRPTEDGFRLYRHRTHIAVRTESQELAVSPYEAPEGILLNQGAQEGWLMVDQAFLHYQCVHEASWLHLDVTLLGYLCKRQPSADIIQVSLGDTTNLPAILPHLPHLRLASQGQAGRLTFQLPAPTTRHNADRYLFHEHNATELPSPLQWGQRYQRGRFAFSCWRLNSPSQGQDESKQQSILLEMRQQAGRKHFALAVVGGRLGYWSEGSAFLQQTGAAAPLFAPDHARLLPSGQEVPAGELLVGSDPRYADLVLPMFYKLEAPLLFSVSFTKGRWHIRPLQGACWGQALRFLNDGGLQREESLWKAPSTMTTEEEPWKWWRCGDLLFELSSAAQDREEYPNTDAMLSIRGVFCAAKERILVGGPPRQATLPLLGSGLPEEQQRPLFSLEASGIRLRFDGDAMLGLRAASLGPDLFSLLQKQLDASPIPPSSKHRLPWRLLAPTEQAVSSPKPPGLHLQQPIHPHTLRDGDLLQVGGEVLRYRRRSEQDGYPSPQDIPACLDLVPSDPIMIPYSQTDTGFLHPTGQIFHKLFLGRPDPKIDLTESLASTYKELFLGPLFAEKDTSAARLCLSGYSPRAALELERRDGQIILSVPAPKAAGAYHVVLEGTPQRKAHSLTLRKAVHLHINHLFRLCLTPSQEGLLVSLEGYMLAHPEDPTWPVHFASENKRGVIQLRNNPFEGLQLQPEVLPASFRVTSNTKQEGPSQHVPQPAEQASSQQATTPEMTLAEPYTPASGPLHLPHGETWSLVDLSSWHSDLLELVRIPSEDRLLWMESSSDSTTGLLFPQVSASNNTTSSQEDEGSNFAFGPPISAAEQAIEEAPSPQPLDDDGSSFAFLPRQIDLAPPSQPKLQEQSSQTADFSTPSARPSQHETANASPSQTADFVSPSHTADFVAPSQTSNFVAPSQTANASPSQTADFVAPSQTADFAPQDNPSQSPQPSHPSTTSEYALPQELHASPPPVSRALGGQTAEFAAPSSPPQSTAYPFARPQGDVSPQTTAEFAAPASPRKLSPPDHSAPSLAYDEQASPAITADLGRSAPVVTTPQAYLGFFASPSEAPCYGYFGSQDGWQLGLIACQERLLAQLHQVPTEESWQARGLAAIWRGGDILPLQQPQLLLEGDMLLCGPAAFLCQKGPLEGQLRITRQWLWLPQEASFSIHADAAKQTTETTLSLHEEGSSWSVQVLPSQEGHLVVNPTPSTALHWSVSSQTNEQEETVGELQVDLTEQTFILHVDGVEREKAP
ncbi:MAG: hypothetical protein H6727_12365 [Myxococcales bacterium]|nr:hypothetical protein [Myxococcales bacterium]